MRRLLFIGHEFHKRTRSSMFLIQLLESDYDIRFLNIDPYSEQPYELLKDHQGQTYDVLVCWQIRPPIHLLRKHIRYSTGVHFPMYDSSPDANKMEKWYPYRNFHIICFCQTLHKNLKKAGFCSHSIQYFPEVLDDCSSGNEQSVFFWNRSEKISSRLLGILFSNSHISHLHIHKALDPKKKFIPPDDSIADSISYSSWYPEKSDMLAEMEKYAIYIAPRIKEGIGMSFLEAMAMGRCVIAPDSPTMNEYITHEVNGLLYSLQDPQPINLSQVTQTQQNARLFIKKGRMKWETQKSNILTWISSTVKIEKKSMLPRVMIRLFTRPIKMMKMLVLDRQHLD